MTRWTEWHGPPPRDGEWRKVHLAYIRERGERLWLKCSSCGHERFVTAETFAAEAALDLSTPLLAISWRLRCTRCGERKAHCLGEPHGFSYWQSKAPGARDADRR